MATSLALVSLIPLLLAASMGIRRSATLQGLQSFILIEPDRDGKARLRARRDTPEGSGELRHLFPTFSDDVGNYL